MKQTVFHIFKNRLVLCIFQMRGNKHFYLNYFGRPILHLKTGE